MERIAKVLVWSGCLAFCGACWGFVIWLIVR